METVNAALPGLAADEPLLPPQQPSSDAPPASVTPIRQGAQSTQTQPAQQAQPADVCLLVEGTYPYVAGGVSSWVHDMLLGQPHLQFAILNVGSHPASYGELRYKLPDNVTGLHKVFCQEGQPPALDGAARSELTAQIRQLREEADARPTPSRVLSAFRRMHLEGEVDDQLIDDLSSGDLTIPQFLHGRASFEMLTEIAQRLTPDAPFLDLFWHFRAIHVPLLRLLSQPLVPASCYHAVSTGYAGLLAAVWSRRSGRPLIVTEHGIYARERDLELSRVDWIRDHQRAGVEQAWTWAPRTSPLRGLWSRFFRTLSRVAYRQATQIVTLSDVNRRKQLADGAPEQKIQIIPNGVDLKGQQNAPDSSADDQPDNVIPLHARPVRVGFVGRVVPIKDVVTFIKACDIALGSVDLDVRIIGPAEEDAEYAKRCRTLVDLLHRTEQIKFLGSQPPAQIYPQLDLVVLTSFSEGQPLVMLEAYAEGLPVIASDVGACREMIEGRTPDDRALGASGIVTRVAAPKETAAAMVRLARDARLRRLMGMAGRKRVTTYYQRREMLENYRALYGAMVSS